METNGLDTREAILLALNSFPTKPVQRGKTPPPPSRQAPFVHEKFGARSVERTEPATRNYKVEKCSAFAAVACPSVSQRVFQRVQAALSSASTEKMVILVVSDFAGLNETSHNDFRNVTHKAAA